MHYNCENCGDFLGQGELLPNVTVLCQRCSSKSRVNKVKGQEYINQLLYLSEQEDGLGVRQLHGELMEDEKMYYFVFKYLTTEQANKVKELMFKLLEK